MDTDVCEGQRLQDTTAYKSISQDFKSTQVKCGPNTRAGEDGPCAERSCTMQGVPSGCLGESKNKLIIAAVIVFIFVIAQFLGGYFANSLAIMTDTANLFLEFTSFLVGILAVVVAKRMPSKRLTFGWHRAEVLAAVASVLLIWLLTALLLYEAVQRIIHSDYDIDADIMLITASFGLLVNILLCGVLHTKDDSSGIRHPEKKRCTRPEADAATPVRPCGSDKARIDGTRGAGRNINVRVALMFVINDLFQSVGVIVSAYIIKFKPEWKLADPLCTFVFSTMVAISSSKIIYDALAVMMEAAPHHANYDDILRGLKSLHGVRGVHSLNIWSLTLSQTAAAAHLVTASENEFDIRSDTSVLSSAG